MKKKKFPKEHLQALVWEDYDDNYKIIYQKLTGHTRWSLVYEMVFQYDGRFWVTSYRTGATELQCEEPYENEPDEIVCVEVHPVEKTITLYQVME